LEGEKSRQPCGEEEEKRGVRPPRIPLGVSRSGSKLEGDYAGGEKGEGGINFILRKKKREGKKGRGGKVRFIQVFLCGVCFLTKRWERQGGLK